MIFLIAAICAGLGVALLLMEPRRTPKKSTADAQVTAASTTKSNGCIAEPRSEEHEDVQADSEAPEARPEEEPNDTDRVVAEPKTTGVAEDSAEQISIEPEHRTAKRNSLAGLLGQNRKRRRLWAHHRNFDYSKSDDFLTDEWSRGITAAGAVAKDVVSGMVDGYEVHLADVHGNPVMAIRRKAISNEVIVAQRSGITAHPTNDLVKIQSVADFEIYATEPGVGQRFIDSRVTAALGALPETVVAVWAEANWVLAQTEKNSSASEWEDMLEPLVLLADSACVLPPDRPAELLDYSDADPTRVMPTATFGEDEPIEPTPLKLIPTIKPKEEHVVLPTRVRGDMRGVVIPHEIGADDVAPIADDLEKRQSNYHGTRILRDPTQPAHIFNDTPETD
ncbi:hypothetical protein CMUST_13710 [Corynebacterium mustelae]|uniref:Secreted protein n=1 Tax=Corynebacterium mustelae TaxID=571915 RepID=A0A0G3H0U5_9CORY|nr:hypothetical protein [Corynebacterium mustelae]AKK07036.1 hypothetical protein CMUST_13710 [Corynebacterium mustelae]